MNCHIIEWDPIPCWRSHGCMEFDGGWFGFVEVGDDTYEGPLMDSWLDAYDWSWEMTSVVGVLDNE